MADTDRKRPWLAAFLAMLSPGLGHVYLREWVRALLWFGLLLMTTSVLVPEPPTTFSFEAVMSTYAALPRQNQLALTAMSVLSMADAYWMATRGNRTAAADEGVRCPHCGKQIDEDLSFCHWCTTRLERPADEEHVAEDRFDA